MEPLEFEIYRKYKELLFHNMGKVPNFGNSAPIPTSFQQLLLKYQAFLFDGFGTLYLYDCPIEGSSQALAELRKRNYPIRLVTNAASRSPLLLSAHIEKLGIQISAHEIICSGDLLQRAMQKSQAKKAFHVGYIEAEYFFEQYSLQKATIEDLHFEDNPHGAPIVVMTSSQPQESPAFHWAQRLLHLPNALLIVLNPDAMAPMSDGSRIPVAGIQAHALQKETGCQVLWMGKPFPDIFKAALDSIPGSSKPLFIGDTVGTDMMGAMAMGIDAALILKGNSSQNQWQKDCNDLGVYPQWLLDGGLL